MTILLGLSLTSINAQDFTSYYQVVEYFNMHPIKYGVEGIYEMWHDYKVEDCKTLRGQGTIKNRNYQGFTKTESFICIISINDTLYGMCISRKNTIAMKFTFIDSLNLMWHHKTRNIKFGDMIDRQIPENTEYYGSAKCNYNSITYTFDPNYVNEFTNSEMSQTYKQTSKILLKKVYNPTFQIQKATGTGFALFSIGFIVTNYHVIDAAKSITVRGIRGDFEKSYKCKVVLSDKINDLSILKVVDTLFKSLGEVPYNLSKNICDVGISVFALGYPKLDIMGREIKLTNGIISSKTGYKGDNTTYQISAPVQPGNSGGPLFNTNGDIVAVVSSGIKSLSNVSYAIKSNLLLNLIDSMDDSMVMPSKNILLGKSIEQQFKIINKFIYIIEVEY